MGKKMTEEEHDTIVQRSIKRYIDLLEEKKMPLHQFVDRFELLLNSIKSDNLRSILYDRWLDFESINASMFCDERDYYSEVEQRVLIDVISQVKKILTFK